MSARNMRMTSTATGFLPATTLGLFAEHALSPHVMLNARAENLLDERVVTRDQGGSIDLGQPRTLWIGLKLTGRRD